MIDIHDWIYRAARVLARIPRSPADVRDAVERTLAPGLADRRDAALAAYAVAAERADANARALRQAEDEAAANASLVDEWRARAEAAEALIVREHDEANYAISMAHEERDAAIARADAAEFELAGTVNARDAAISRYEEAEQTIGRVRSVIRARLSGEPAEQGRYWVAMIRFANGLPLDDEVKSE